MSVCLGLMVFVPCIAYAATRTWTPTVTGSGGKYYWSTAANWLDENGNTGLPQTDDDVVLGGGYTIWGILATRLSSMTLSTTAGSVGLSGSGPSFLPAGRGIIQTTGKSVSYWLSISVPAGVDLPIDTRNVNGTVSLDENVTGGGRFVKRGPGTVRFGSKAPTGTPGASSTRDFSWHGLVVEGGTASFGNYDYNKSGFELVFSGNDASARVKLGSKNQTFADVNLYESNGVANTEHGFTSDSAVALHFTGTPARQPTVFSGRLYKKIGLCWAPDDTGSTFVVSNAVSSTTGSLTVSNGVVRLVDGASFSDLSSVTVCSGGRLEIETGAGAAFSALTLGLEAGGTLSLGSGCDVSFESVTAGGSLELAARAFVRCSNAVGPSG